VSRIYRTARVSGFADPDNAHVALINAHLAAGLPAYGDLFPDVDFAYLKHKFTVPVSDDMAFVTMIYEINRWQNTFIKSYSGSLNQISVNYDKDGHIIKNQYIPPGSTRKVFRYPAIKRYVPQAQLTYIRGEGVNPESIATAYLGAVNSSTWRGYPARTWMFTDVEGESDTLGLTWMNRYTFSYNPLTWDTFDVFKDDYGNAPPGVPDIDFTGATTSGNGWIRTQGQPEASFGTAFSWAI
jgi:hypothetical protein